MPDPHAQWLGKLLAPRSMTLQEAAIQVSIAVGLVALIAIWSPSHTQELWATAGVLGFAAVILWFAQMP